MEENTYKTMSYTGIWSLVLGIVTICSGIAIGVMMIVNGAKLLKNKSELTF